MFWKTQLFGAWLCEKYPLVMDHLLENMIATPKSILTLNYTLGITSNSAITKKEKKKGSLRIVAIRTGSVPDGTWAVQFWICTLCQMHIFISASGSFDQQIGQSTSVRHSACPGIQTLSPEVEIVALKSVKRYNMSIFF